MSSHPQQSDSRVAYVLDLFTPQTLAETVVRLSDERDRYREALRAIREDMERCECGDHPTCVFCKATDGLTGERS